MSRSWPCSSLPGSATLVAAAGVALLSLAACSSSTATAPEREPSCTPTVLLGGGALPAAQGWSETGCVVGTPAATNGTRLTVDTQAVAGCSGITSAQQLYTRDVGLLPGTAVILEWQMQVTSVDTHNAFDAGVAFLPAFTPPFGVAAQRSQMIYFDAGKIGWADDTASHAVDTTAAAHLYRLEVDAAGNARVLVDGVPALSRTGLSLNGTIAFGDQTNDLNVDGAFVLDFIRLGCP